MAKQRNTAAAKWNGLDIPDRRLEFGIYGKDSAKNFTDLSPEQQAQVEKVFSGKMKAPNPGAAKTKTDDTEKATVRRRSTEAATKKRKKREAKEPAKKDAKTGRKARKPAKEAKAPAKRKTTKAPAAPARRTAFNARRRTEGNGDPVALYLYKNTETARDVKRVWDAAHAEVVKHGLITDKRAKLDKTRANAAAGRRNALARMALGLMLRRYWRLINQGGKSRAKDAAAWLSGLMRRAG